MRKRSARKGTIVSRNCDPAQGKDLPVFSNCLQLSDRQEPQKSLLVEPAPCTVFSILLPITSSSGRFSSLARPRLDMRPLIVRFLQKARFIAAAHPSL